ncbi:MAG TPA: chaperone modulator CbpM [Geminicoccaceae bacterium]|nr:chaperone modulator CbpM [Geminicoccaceae bacterium]
MKTLSEVVVLIGRIDRVELHRWIELGWVAPARPAGRAEAEPAFSDFDIARVRLICDLRHDLAVEEETMPLVLSLLDQLYALRRQMKTLIGALRQQPDEVRRAIMDVLEASRRQGGALD